MCLYCLLCLLMQVLTNCEALCGLCLAVMRFYAVTFLVRFCFIFYILGGFLQGYFLAFCYVALFTGLYGFLLSMLLVFTGVYSFYVVFFLAIA